MIGFQGECLRDYYALYICTSGKGPPLDIKQPKRDADNSYPSSIDVKN